jgi:type IV pilus assembly protein PilO
MSADQISRPKAVVMNVRERSRSWLNAVNLHWAGVALLGLLNVYLLVQMGIAWRLATTQDADALAQQRVQLKAAEIGSKPLQGLDVKLAVASDKADQFYMERLPVSYSEIATELGVLKNRSKVRLTHLNYSQPATAGGPNGGDKTLALIGPDKFGGRLTEVTMDANLTGDYRGLVTFINGLERDKTFFLVNGVTLTGQQTGVVSLRLRLTTYLRGLVPADQMPKNEPDETAASPLAAADKAVETQAAKSAAAGGSR